MFLLLFPTDGNVNLRQISKIPDLLIYYCTGGDALSKQVITFIGFWSGVYE